VVRILKSANGEDWQSIALLEKKGIDLRDPKLSVTPDGRIMVIIGGSIYHESKLIYAEKAQQFANNLTRVQNQETGQYYTWWDSNPKHQIIGWFNCATEDIKAILEYDKMNKNN
jgi:hypothetical protein